MKAKISVQFVGRNRDQADLAATEGHRVLGEVWIIDDAPRVTVVAPYTWRLEFKIADAPEHEMNLEAPVIESAVLAMSHMGGVDTLRIL